MLGTYYFDGDGKRIKMAVPSTGETTIFVYDVGGKEIAEYSTNVAPIEDAKVQYRTNDILGTPRINTDSNGRISGRHDCMAYLEEIIVFGGRTSSDKYFGDDVRQGFTGFERDTETDLDFAQARMYNKNHGRFTTTDPMLSSGSVIDPQNWNRSSYTLNNSLNSIDPLGLWTWGKSLGGSASDEEWKKHLGQDPDLDDYIDGILTARKEIRDGINDLNAKLADKNSNLSERQKKELERSINSYGRD